MQLDTRTHANFGRALEEADRKKEAIEAFKKALKLDPNNDTAKERLAILEPDTNPIENKENLN